MSPVDADDAERSLLLHMPRNVLWQELYTHLDPRDALSLAATCKPFYQDLFQHYPTFRSDHYGVAHDIAQCFQDMLHAVREHPAGMIGWYFSREWHSRHGYPLARGACMFIVRLPRARNMFIVSDACGGGSRAKVDTGTRALDWFRCHIMDSWPHVEVRSHCTYKHRRRRDSVSSLHKRMISLLNAYEEVRGREDAA